MSVCARVLSIARLTAAGLFRTAFAEITNNSTGRMRLKSGKALRGAVSPQHEEEALEAGCKGGREEKADKRKVPADLHLQGLKNLGWEMGLEPTTTGITIRDSTN